MPLFKTRSTRIRPLIGTSEIETTRVEISQPKLDIFLKVSGNNNRNKRKLRLTERMDDPEEVCDLSPLSMYYHQSGRHLDIPQINDKQIFYRRSMDFCQTDFPPPPNFQPTRKNPDGQENVEDYGGCSFVLEEDRLPVWRRQESTSVCVDRSASKGTRWLLKDIDKTSQLKFKFNKPLNAMKTNDLHTWTSSPDRFYNYISKVQHDKINDSSTMSVDTSDYKLKHSLLSKNGNSHERHVWFPPDVLVFECVLDNQKDELELVLRYSKTDVNVYSNARELSPLHLAAQLGHTDCVRVLLHYGANVNFLDARGHSSLYKAFSGLHFECAVLLIEAGAHLGQFTTQKIREIEKMKKASEYYRHTLQE